VTPGAVAPGTVRVVVSRAVAHVPGCPEWKGLSQPDYANNTMSNFGCGVNGALAAQVANAEDLVRGTAGPSAQDGATASKAIGMYRSWPLTGITDGQTKRPLKKVESTARKED
jgi:pilus assembly protein CpaD